jgi:hypothetical protein
LGLETEVLGLGLEAKVLDVVVHNAQLVRRGAHLLRVRVRVRARGTVRVRVRVRVRVGGRARVRVRAGEARGSP